MIAFFSEGVPPAAVYLVRPLRIAAIAASLMKSGVSKSGSPAPIEITSLPSAFSLAALAETARVGEGLMTLRRFATSDIDFSGRKGGKRMGQTLFYLLELIKSSVSLRELRTPWPS